MASSRKLPGSRLSRLTQLARVGARTGASLLLSRDGGRAAADQAAEVLGSLRGLAAKVGQMASYVDGVVPEAHRDAYETALATLRAATPSSSPAAVRHLVEEELGEPVDRLYAEWDDVPMASASIGQVHAARMHDGREVAVKVQHPGIERAVESDLQNARVLEGMVGVLGPRALESRRVYEEIAQRFREELDYGLEATRQVEFAGLHQGDAHIRIPAVVSERCSRRVLTTERVRGMSFDQVPALPEEQRRHYAEVLWRFVYKSNLVGALFNADPHPGNYFFGDDGSVTFIDFGCVQPIPEPRLVAARKLHRAARSGDDAAFADAAVRILDTRGGAYERDAIAYVRRCFEPIRCSPFRITRPYVAEVVQGVSDLKHHYIGLGDGSLTPMPEGMVFMNRLQFGFYSVLARLDAEVDYAAVEDRFFAEAGLD